MACRLRWHSSVLMVLIVLLMVPLLLMHPHTTRDGVTALKPRASSSEMLPPRVMEPEPWASSSEMLQPRVMEPEPRASGSKMLPPRIMEPEPRVMEPEPQWSRWSLAPSHGALTYHCAYNDKLMWNAFPHIKRALQRVGYSSGDRTTATVLVVPSKPRTASQDWPRWVLTPAQRINRVWGMRQVARKDGLHQMLDAHWGSTRCPFAPATFDWAELRSHPLDTLTSLLQSRSRWILKTTAHRGKGVRLVQTIELLRAAALLRSAATDFAPGAAKYGAKSMENQVDRELLQLLRPMSRGEAGVLVQSVIEDPLLIGGHKVSRRL